MPGTKDELRAEIAALREELAAEKAKVEVLREQAGRCGCHPGGYWCVICGGLRWPGHACTYITWTAPVPGAAPQPWQQYRITSGGAWSGDSPVTYGVTSVAAGCAGAGISTYTLLS